MAINPMVQSCGKYFMVVGCLILVLGCAGKRETLLADQFADKGRWETAVFLYREAARKDPDSLDLQEKLAGAKTQLAAQHYQGGQARLQAKDVMVALEAFKKAISLDPQNAQYRESLEHALNLKEARNRTQAGLMFLEAGRYSEAQSELEQALALDPMEGAVEEILQELAQRQEEAPSDEIDLVLQSNVPITLKFRNARLVEVFEFLSRAAGVNILFDKDVRPESSTVTVFIKDASFKQALSLMLTTNNLFMKKVNDRTILIIPNTRQKVKQYQDLVIRTFYLSSVGAKDMVNLLRTMLETRRIFVNESLNAVVIRDTPEKIALAQKIIEANDRMVAEVMLEVEVLEVTRTTGTKMGWNVTPSQAQAFLGKASSGDDSGSSGSLSGGGLTLTSDDPTTVFFTLPTVVVDFLKQESEAETLANPRIRVLSGKTAKINIGDRVPILLSTTTTSAVSAGVSGNVSTATSVEFKDVGIKLDVEPKVHLNNDVTMKLKLEVTSLGDLVDLGNNVKQFRFGTRSAETELSMESNETVIIGGLIRDEDRITLNKFPGLGEIPFVGRLFSNEEKGKVKTDILLMITPTVVRGIKPPDRRLQKFWSGTEDNYSSEPLFSDVPSGVQMGDQPGDADEPRMRPPVILPGQSFQPEPDFPVPSTIRRDRSSLSDSSLEREFARHIGK